MILCLNKPEEGDHLCIPIVHIQSDIIQLFNGCGCNSDKLQQDTYNVTLILHFEFNDTFLIIS
jgi:hypothetical protein